MAKAANARTKIEPQLNILDARKPDLLISTASGNHTLIDVTIVHHATFNRILANSDANSVLASASKAKHRKYEDGIPAGTTFKAAAATSFGQFSKDLTDIFTFLNQENSKHSALPNFDTTFITEFICALQRGNAHIVREWASHHKQIAKYANNPHRSQRSQARLQSLHADQPLPANISMSDDDIFDDPQLNHNPALLAPSNIVNQNFIFESTESPVCGVPIGGDATASNRPAPHN